MPTPSDPNQERVLVLAPRGRNAPLIIDALVRGGSGGGESIRTFVCRDIQHLCDELAHPTGAAVICEEALGRAAGLSRLVETLARQEPWSEIPLLVLTSGGETTRSSFNIAQTLGPRGNVTLLERPVRIITLLSAVQVALRARRRQYEVRDLLAREQAARAQAERASQAKDHFLAMLSHELRTPLNPVLMTVVAMAGDPTLPEPIRDDIDMIRRNVELESRLIDDLLDLTRIARGKLVLHPEAVDVHAILDHAVSTCCESDVRRKRIQILKQFDAESSFVWGDAGRLAQVFWNLIKNAVKFTPEGGQVRLRTLNDPQAGGIAIEVTDTGIGIEPDAIGRIFQAFEQEDRGIARRFGGLGLGLAIARALVELHGGTIEVASDGKGKGATFTVRLAATADPRPSDGNGSSDDIGGGAAHDGLDILLVEDHEATARVMSKLLRMLNYRVTVAPDLRTALQLVDELPIDVLVSDLGLPDGTGYELIRQVRPRHAFPAIAVSGYGMEDDVRQSLAAGFDDHLVKPVDLPKLQAAILKVTAAAAPRLRNRTPAAKRTPVAQ